MLLIIKTKDDTLYRTVTRDNTKKVAKGLVPYFPNLSYPAIEALIFNLVHRGLDTYTVEIKEK